MSLAKQLQNTASNHSGDLGGLLWDAGAKILQLEDENEALRAQLSEKNIGQGVPDGWLLIATNAYEAGYGKGLKAKQTGMETENPWGDEPGRGAWAIGYELAKERASAPPAPRQKPLTDEHVTDGSKCWCDPELDYKDPHTGVEVWVHRSKQ